MKAITHSFTTEAAAAGSSSEGLTAEACASDVFLFADGKQLGPFSLNQALRLVRRMRLESQAWIWRVGMPCWEEVSDYLAHRSSFRDPRAGAWVRLY